MSSPLYTLLQIGKLTMNIFKSISLLSFSIASITLISGCATTRFEGSCHELAVNAESAIEDKVEKAQSGTFKRHLILLETGTEISNNCRTHYIDEETYQGIPASLMSKCQAQSRGQTKYCTLYSLDGETKKIRVY